MFDSKICQRLVTANAKAWRREAGWVDIQSVIRLRQPRRALELVNPDR